MGEGGGGTTFLLSPSPLISYLQVLRSQCKVNVQGSSSAAEMPIRQPLPELFVASQALKQSAEWENHGNHRTAWPQYTRSSKYKVFVWIRAIQLVSFDHKEHW